jgi:hypothetical protein
MVRNIKGGPMPLEKLVVYSPSALDPKCGSIVYEEPTPGGGLSNDEKKILGVLNTLPFDAPVGEPQDPPLPASLAVRSANLEATRFFARKRLSDRSVYYAHCVALYNTKQEARDLELLTDLFGCVYNPNNIVCANEYKKHGMDFFTALVKSFQYVAFRALPDGSIPCGVLAEVQAAQKAGAKIIELPSAIVRRGLDVAATREYLTEVGFR